MAEILNRPVTSVGSSLGPQMREVAGLFRSADTVVHDVLSFPAPQSGGLHGHDVYAAERAAFRRLLPELARSHGGQFVAIHRGQPWGFDTSRNELVRRFFTQNARGTAVYIGFLGPRPIVRVPTPTIRRRSG